MSFKAKWLSLLVRSRETVLGRVGWMQVYYCFLPGLLMTSLLLNSNIKRLGSIALVHQAGDSWVPISNALHYINANKDLGGLYKATYFDAQYQFMYPPQALALFDILSRYLGFSFGDLWQAKIASWLLLPILAYISYLVLRLQQSEAKLAIKYPEDVAIGCLVSIASVYLFFPLTLGYAVGNIQNFLTLFVCLSLMLHVRGKNLAAGCLFGVAMLVKPHIGIFIIWALLRKNFKFAAGLILVGALASVVSLRLYGWEPHLAYIELLRYLSDRGESFYASHSIESTIYRVMHEGNNLNWDSRHLSLRPNALIHGMATVLGAIAICFAFWPRRDKSPLLRLIDFGIAYMTVIIASPVSYEHHFGLSFLLIPVVAFWAIYIGSKKSDLTFIGISYACLANVFPISDWLANTNFNILQSYRLLGTSLLIWQMLKLRGALQSGDLETMRRVVVSPPQSLVADPRATPPIG